MITGAFVFLSLYEFHYGFTTNSELGVILGIGFALNAYIAFQMEK